MNFRTILSSAALFAAAALSAAAQEPAAKTPAAPAPEPFSFKERKELRTLADDVRKALADVGLPAALPISTLPIAGDSERYLEGLLKNAITGAGLNYVEGRDDPMWNAIIAEIKWDDYKGDMLDEATLTKLGRLQATRMLVYGRLFLDTDEWGRTCTELVLHISNIETKQHVWGETFVKNPPEPKPAVTFDEFPVVLADALLSVRVDSIAADEAASSATLADALGSDTRDALAAAGFAVLEGADAKDAEIAVSLKSSATAFDREKDNVRFDGTTRLVATLPADRNRVLGEKTIDRHKSRRAVGDAAALANLREDFAATLRAWLGETVTAENAGLRSVSIKVDFADLKEPELEQRITTLVDAVAKTDGVRDARVVSRLPLPDGKAGARVTLRVLFRPVDVPEGIATRIVATRPDLFRKTVPAKPGKPAPDGK